MAFNPELGSTSPAVLLDNAERLDKLVNGPAATVPDRAGQPRTPAPDRDDDAYTVTDAQRGS